VIILAALLAIGFFIPACRGVYRTYFYIRHWSDHPDDREIAVIVACFYPIIWGGYGLPGLLAYFYLSWVMYTFPNEPR
jgi:hypothetical protein